MYVSKEFHFFSLSLFNIRWIVYIFCVYKLVRSLLQGAIWTMKFSHCGRLLVGIYFLSKFGDWFVKKIFEKIDTFCVKRKYKF